MEDFYNRYQKYVLNYFKARLGNDNPEAEDLASEVMLKAWQSFPKFEGKSTVLHWIHRIAVNKYLDYYRRRKIVSFCSLDTGYTSSKDGEKDGGQDWAELLLIDDNDPSDKLLKEETKKSVRMAISKLKPHHKEVIMMHYFNNMEVEDIAKSLDVPSGTIKSRLFRARESLQKKLLPILQDKSLDD